METGGTDLTEAEEIFNIRGDKDIEEGITGGIENLDEFTRIKKAMGGRIGFRGGGGYQGGRSSGVDRGPSARDRAMGSGGKQKGGTNTKSGGGGGGRTTPTKTKTSTINPFSKTNQLTHFKNNQLLKNAVQKGLLTNKEYNILGGYDATQTLGLGPIDTGLASLSYNVAQSVLGNQPFSDILGDVGRNIQGARGLSPGLMNTYENIIGQNLADGGSVDLTIVRMPDITELGVESLFKTR